MKTFLKNIMIFLLGAGVGSYATMAYVKKKYSFVLEDFVDYIANDISEDLEKEVKDAFDVSTKSTINKKYYEDSDKKPLNEIDTVVNNEKINIKLPMDKPYIITPDEFGEFYDYETITLVYYADGVLTDDDDEIIDDPDEIIGLDNLKRFGEFDDSSIHVRNDQKKCDYEILKDKTSYADSCFNNEQRRK